MKKRILDILLIALLIVNIGSCNFDSKGDIDDPFENIDNTKSRFEETDKKNYRHKETHKIYSATTGDSNSKKKTCISFWRNIGSNGSRSLLCLYM